jgi:large subunit ribosomal protein L4
MKVKVKPSTPSQGRHRAERCRVRPRAARRHSAPRRHLAARKGARHARATRERSDVARTGKKFGRQKGGGTARHGDRAPPVFIGGGKAHGARRRDFNPSLNKKVRALGLKMALSSKAKDGLVIVDSLDVKTARPRRWPAARQARWGKKVLVIDGEARERGLSRGFGNLVGVNVLPAVGANVYDILKHDTLVLTRAAVEKLEARFNG